MRLDIADSIITSRHATGRRVWKCELSTIDSAILFAGALTAAMYFDRDTPDEREIRQYADFLYRRADRQWAQNKGLTVSHGWHPESGFIKYRWEGYDEALILYALALGSPTFPLPIESYRAWSSSYEWKSIYGIEFLYAGPLFIHQLSHLWLDLREIQDDFMRGKGIDILKIAAERHWCSNAMPSATRISSRATENTAGELLRATVRAR